MADTKVQNQSNNPYDTDEEKRREKVRTFFSSPGGQVLPGGTAMRGYNRVNNVMNSVMKQKAKKQEK